MPNESRKKVPFGDREIIRMHQLAATGVSCTALAKMFSCNINTVVEHLALRVCYPQRIYRAIGTLKPIPKSDPLPIYDAAIFLPDWPSPDKVYRLASAGILKTTKDGRKLVTDFKAIRKCALAMLPAGIWCSNRSLESFLPLDSIAELEPYARQLEYWPTPSRQIRFFPMPRVFEKAAEKNQRFSVPAVVVHRCLEIEKISGVATI